MCASSNLKSFIPNGQNDQTTEYSFVHLTDAELCQLVADHSNPRTGDPVVKRAAAECLERRDELRQTCDAVMASTRSRCNRRSFLKSLFGVAALAALPKVRAIARANPESIPTSTLANLNSDPRAAVIKLWRQRIDETLIHLERFWTFLGAANRQAPAAVDPSQFASLELAAVDAMETLLHQLEMLPADDLARACTGLEPRQIYGTSEFPKSEVAHG